MRLCPVVPSDTRIAAHGSMAIGYRQLYKSPQHCAAKAAFVLLTGIRNPGLRPYLLMPVVPSDTRIAAHASMAAILVPSGDLYSSLTVGR